MQRRRKKRETGDGSLWEMDASVKRARGKKGARERENREGGKLGQGEEDRKDEREGGRREDKRG